MSKSQENPRVLWIIQGAFVTEPWLGGFVLGELPEYDVTDCKLVHYTQAEIDKMMEDYREEHGEYPIS
jgi:hypothetical protein